MFCGEARRITFKFGDKRLECGSLICPEQFDAAQQKRLDEEAATDAKLQLEAAQHQERIEAQGDQTVCPKCGGNGDYIWPDGERDVCYGCDGDGTGWKFTRRRK